MRPDHHHHHHHADGCRPRHGGPGARHRHHPAGPWGPERGQLTDHPDRFGFEAWGPGDPGGPRGRGRGPRGRGRGRAARGDVRAGVLALLAEAPMHGYQIMRELAERSNGAWRPSPGSVYPTLQQLEDEGLVVAEKEGRGRRLFSLTDEGRADVAEREGQPAPWDAVAGDEPAGHHELRQVVFQVLAATKQVAAAGSEPQVRRAEQLLKETRRGLYRILAEDEESETTEAPAPGTQPEADAS